MCREAGCKGREKANHSRCVCSSKAWSGRLPALRKLGTSPHAVEATCSRRTIWHDLRVCIRYKHKWPYILVAAVLLRASHLGQRTPL